MLETPEEKTGADEDAVQQVGWMVTLNVTDCVWSLRGSPPALVTQEGVQP